MPKKIDYQLTTEQLNDIEAAIRGAEDHRVRLRARMIRLLSKGHDHEEIADLLSVSRGQVYYWHKRWREAGLDGLVDKARTGRPKVGDEEYRRKLASVLGTDPQELGYAFTVWNIPRLVSYMEEETGTRVHENTLRNILSEMGYVFRRPKHDLSPLQDKAAKARAQEVLEELKKKPPPAKSNYSLWTKQP